MLVVLSSDQAEARRFAPSLFGQLSNALATQLSSFFIVKGEIVEAGKLSEKES